MPDVKSPTIVPYASPSTNAKEAEERSERRWLIVAAVAVLAPALALPIIAFVMYVWSVVFPP